MRVPTFPKTNTLAARALMRLLMGQNFTHLEFQRETHSYRLSEFIRKLRHKHKWPIVTREETALTKDPVGRTVDYGRYFIKQDDLIEIRKLLGERIDAFVDAVREFETRPAATDRVRGA